MAEHLRKLFSTPSWLLKHAHTKINEIVVLYIDKDETDPDYPKFHWPVVKPKYQGSWFNVETLLRRLY